MNSGLVIQSHRRPLPATWLRACLESVEYWAHVHGFDYRFLGDEFFDLLDDDLRIRTEERIVVASDIARLKWLNACLADYETVIWCDADFLIHDPGRLLLSDTDCAVGREVWIQPSGVSGKLKAHKKVHNAFLMFRRGDSFLGFYLKTAERLVREHFGPMVPQFVGPKLLTALHNVVKLPVIESAAMLPPAVARELIGQPGQAVDLFRRRSQVTPAGVNLCASLCGRGWRARRTGNASSHRSPLRGSRRALDIGAWSVRRPLTSRPWL